MSTVAAIIIGDEILSGAVRDTNTGKLVDLMRQLEVDLGRISIIGDGVEEIAEEVRAVAPRFDAVITSGGLGPTHDDRTVKGVARAFGLEVVRHPEVEAMIRGFWRGRRTEEALRMADVPEGSRLLHGNDGFLPIVVCRNVYLLPGIPRLFETKLQSLRGELEGTPHVRRSLVVSGDESDVARFLDVVDEEYPGVKIGSYPQPDRHVWITFDGRHRSDVEAAFERLRALLPEQRTTREGSPGGSRTTSG